MPIKELMKIMMVLNYGTVMQMYNIIAMQFMGLTNDK